MIALLLLGALLVYIGIGSIVYKVVAKPRLGRWRGLLVTGVIFFLIPAWDIIPGILYFNYLCEKGGGHKIYKTVEADGYYDGSYYRGCDRDCVLYLVGSFNDKSLYIETEVRIPQDKYLVTEPGFYKFYLAYTGDINCEKYELVKGKEKYAGYFKSHPALPNDMCIASKLINKKISKYEFKKAKRYEYSRPWRIAALTSSIIDTSSGDVISEAKQFVYNWGWLSRLAGKISVVGNSIYCPVGNEYYPLGLFDGIINKSFK